jgi:hypothetical protein
MMIPDTFDYQIGLTSGSMLKLENLATPVDYPKGDFMPYATEQVLVSGLVRGTGLPVDTWTWDVMTREQRDMMRTFCPGKSALVYIKTKTKDTADSYHIYQAVMVWPTSKEVRDAQRRTGFAIAFQSMVFIS